jgi:hypothetical protein
MHIDILTSLSHTYSWNSCFRQHKMLWILGVVIGFFLSASAGVLLAQYQCEYGDFYVFYVSGQRYLQGESLYSRSVAGLSFLYTPFAALLHTPLSLLSLKQASAAFSGFNVFALLLFYAFTFFWTQIRWNMRIIEWVLACLVTTYFFLINIPLVQNNIFLLLLCIFALECFMQKKYLPAALLISIAALVKVYFFSIVIWMILRAGYKFLLYILLTFLFCISLTLLFRGYNLTWMDWNQYRHYVLAGASEGNIFTDFRNQSLWAFVSRGLEWFNPNYVRYSRVIVSGFIICVLSLSVILVMRQRFLHAKISLVEPAIFLCIAHLASYYTWNQHLVSLFLPACVLGVLAFRLHNVGAASLLVLYMSIWLTISGISPDWQKMVYSAGFLTLLPGFTLVFFLWILFQKSIGKTQYTSMPEP